MGKFKAIKLLNFVLICGSGIRFSLLKIMENPDKTFAENLIIGTGYSGAVAALRLAERGKPATMLEMGLDWGKAGIPFSRMIRPGRSAAWLRRKTIAPFLNIFPLKKFTGTLDRWDYPFIKIWMGRGVGGGSLVNGGMAVRPKQDWFKKILPELDDELIYQKYFPLAEKELKVNTADEDFLSRCDYYQFSRVGEMEARKAGFRTVRVPNVYDFKHMEQEHGGGKPGSAFRGEVIYGNNHGKNSLDKTYLEKALATGIVEIRELHHAQSIRQEADGTYTVFVNKINTLGQVREKIEMRCRNLFLCAGTMGTLELLLRSKAEHQLPMNEEVGKNWGNNGNFMTGRSFVQMFRGGTGTRHSTIPVGGIDNWDDPEHPFFAEIAPLPTGIDLATSLYLMIIPPDRPGSVSYNAVTRKINVHWDASNTAKMRRTADYFIRKMNAANGGMRSLLLFKNGFGADICYHPLGGAVLGKATDLGGRLKGHRNLFVLDGSLIPVCVGVNPFLTITALAEYCMEKILRNA